MYIRQFILLTLSHAESGEMSHYTPHFVLSKCRSLFNCEKVVVVKELHKTRGYHYHVGILNDSATRDTATKLLRKAFPEFEGGLLNVKFHKSWNTICAYLLKEDKNPYCWGTTKEECEERVGRRKNGKKSLDFVSRLSACNSWKEVITDKFLSPRVARSYSSVKQLYLDLKGHREIEPLQIRLKEYLRLNESNLKQILPYSNHDLLDRGPTIQWLGENLDRERPIRTPQLLLVGPPGSGKTSFVELLSRFLNIYHVPMRKDDYSKASTSVDLWFYDELTVKRVSSEVINKVLDGSSVDLDAKYGHLFEKRKNIGVIMACNKPPKFDSPIQTEAFNSRVIRCDFSILYPEVIYSAERLAKTLLLMLESRDTHKLEESCKAVRFL